LSRWVTFAKKGILPEISKQEISVDELKELALNNWLPEELNGLDQKMLSLIRQEPLTVIDAGKIMTALFLQRRDMFGLKRLRIKQKELYSYQIFPHQTSSKVLKLFWDSADCATICRALRI
jgi:hypothetical protein